MKNYYIERDNKNIVSLCARPQYKNHESLSEDDQEIISFLKEQEQALKKEVIDIDAIFKGATTIAGLRAACIQAFSTLNV